MLAFEGASHVQVYTTCTDHVNAQETQKASAWQSHALSAGGGSPAGGARLVQQWRPGAPGADLVCHNARALQLHQPAAPPLGRVAAERHLHAGSVGVR